MIKVGELTHARLAELAAEHGTTIGGYVGELASAQRTQAEWVAVAQQTRAYLGEHFGFDPTPQVRAEVDAEQAAIRSDLAVQFATRRGTRNATGRGRGEVHGYPQRQARR